MSEAEADDLVERLRSRASEDDFAGSHYDKLHCALLREAANIITALRVQLAEAEGERKKIYEIFDAEKVDWRDDPSSDERWNAGVDFAMVQVCNALGVDPRKVNWDAATETLDGDMQAVVWNILRTRFGEDWEPPTFPREENGGKM